MIAAALLLLAQATPAAAGGQPERFSILVDPCASGHDVAGKDIIVCGRTDAIGPRMPLRDRRGPPGHAVPANPELNAAAALNLEATPCAASLRGCTTGFGPPVVPMLAAAAGAVKGALRKRPDKAGRVPIDLGDPPTP